MYREPLDIYDERPSEMVAYLRHNGMHFNGKAQAFAASLMRKRNPATGKNERIDPWSKDQVDDMLKHNFLRYKYLLTTFDQMIINLVLLACKYFRKPCLLC